MIDVKDSVGRTENDHFKEVFESIDAPRKQYLAKMDEYVEDIKKSRYRILCTHIDWDTDGESIIDLGLPTCVTIYYPTDDMIEDAAAYNGAIADYLSDTYGFCINSCQVKVVDENGNARFVADHHLPISSGTYIDVAKDISFGDLECKGD